jgi:tRNA1(Val) A37 N6-methylase TrmN6
MEQLQNGYTLELCPGAFPLSTDSVALAGFVKLPPKAAVLDLGSGCGTLGLMLCAADSGCTVTGIELDENAHFTALENSRRNGLSSRLFSICSDIANIPKIIAPGSFRCCVSNPPYFVAGPASQTHQTARREDTCPLDTLLSSAAWALKYGGDFYLVHRPERLAQLCGYAEQNDLEPKRLCLLRHKEKGPVSLVLLACRKGAKPGLLWEEICLHDANGHPTEIYKTIYHQ